jgi:hypothetical protein
MSGIVATRVDIPQHEINSRGVTMPDETLEWLYVHHRNTPIRRCEP